MSKEFVTHGYLVMSNSHSYEIEINDTGEAVRLKDTNDGEISDWCELDEVGTEDGAKFTCWESEFCINQFMKL